MSLLRRPGLGANGGVRRRKGLYCRKEHSGGGGPTGGGEETGSEATSKGLVRTREDLNEERSDGISQSLGLYFPYKTWQRKTKLQIHCTCILEENWSQTAQVLGPRELGTHW